MSKPLRAGALNHRITIMQVVSGQNETTGEVEETLIPVAEVWANKHPLSAREFLGADARNTKVSTLFIIRYRTGIEASMRIIDGNSIYNIEGPPLPDDRSGKEWLTLMASEVNAS
jgi:SPP1 family predicted phage head-tail adaptor